MSKEIQKDEFILQGNIGTVNGQEITRVFKGNDGFTTITLTPFVESIEMSLPPTNDNPFINSLNEAEDIPCEIVELKQLPEPNTKEK